MTKPIASLAVILVSTVCFANQAHAQTEQWECAVNLQQGDTGTMSLTKNASQVEGRLTTVRNGNDFKSELNGSWNDNTLNLTRLLDASSNEPMAGVVVSLGTNKVKIGGRFSSEYQGVWSADCDLVSSLAIAQPSSDESEADDASNSIPPSITSRVSPSTPSTNDRIKFSARASHPDGIKSLAFYIGAKKVHSCDSNACEFEYGPVNNGTYNWYALATSKSGISNEQRTYQLVVSRARAATCLISGAATGPSANLALSYRVTLVGRGDQVGFRTSSAFRDLKYAFNNIPKGEYTLSIDTQSDPSVLWSPRAPLIKCGAQAEIQQNFDFR